MELVIALAGTRRSPAVLAAVVCALNIQTVLEMCWLGAMVATSVAVGAQVGAGDAAGAKRAARLGVGAAFAAASTAAGGLLAARPLIARLYSHDADVVELTGRCVPALALLVFFDAQNVCIQGTLSGAGAPQRIAMSNLVGWYVVGAPTALGLIFGLDLDAGAAPVLLACCGLALGTSFVLQLLALRSLDWDKQVAEAEGRLDEGTDALAEPLLTSDV